jgi:3-deoxy-7-phosphoheptulonate synthase
MIISMQQGASEEQIQHVIERIEALGFRAHVIRGRERCVIGVLGDARKPEMESLATAPGVDQAVRILDPYKLVSRNAHPEGSVVQLTRGITIGGETLFIAAGPCSVETREQIGAAAQAVKAAGATALRGGAFKPRSSPYSFQGLGASGLEMLAEAAQDNGLALVTEVMSEQQIPLVSACADMLQVGARNMQNYELLKALGRCGTPVLLKRGLSATITELLLSAEYIVQGGNPQVVLCERGIRTFETATRNTLDLNSVALLKEKTHLPVIVDPSHATGVRSLVPAASKAAIAAGADGLLIEVHPDPEAALSDGAQSLAPEEFAALMLDLEGYAELEGRRISSEGGELRRRQPGEVSQLRRRIEQLDAQIIRAAAERTRVAGLIGRRKLNANQPVRDARQEAVVLAGARDQGLEAGLSPELAEKIIALLVAEAVALQAAEQESAATPS